MAHIKWNVSKLLSLLLVISQFDKIILQYIENDIPLRCPENWIRHESSCYRFIKSPIRPRADAQRNCQAYNAELININSMDEHRFIERELTWQDPQHRRWYTGGKQQSPNYWINEGDGTSLNDLNNLFLPENFHDLSMPNRDFLAYNFTNKWSLEKVSGDEHLTYICEAPFSRLSYLVAEERSFSFGVDVDDPEKIPRGPYFVKQPTNVVYDNQNARDYKDVSMTCIAKGYPVPTYEWFREEYERDKYISKKIDPLADKRYSLSGGSLIVNNPQQADRGTYFCKATNVYGTIVSESVLLSFGYIGDFNLNRANESGAQNWGKTINCDPPEYYPSVKYYWSRPRFPDLVEEDKRVFSSHDGTLYFSALEKIDNGFYSCTVQGENSGSSKGKNGPVFLLEVKPSPNSQQLVLTNAFPKVFPGAPVAGHDVRLECVAFGYPVPSYNWTRKGAPLPKKAKLQNFNRVLIIPSVKMEDQGEYVCRATNDYSVKEGSIILSIQAEPNFTIPLMDQHMDIRSDLTWTCEAFGMPDVTYKWFKNGEPLVAEKLTSADASRYIIQDNILSIKNLNPERDNGMYQCRARNTLKTKYSSAQLRVLSLAPTFKRRPLDPEMYAGEGQKVTIYCNPEAAPRPKFIWRKDDILIGSGGPKFILEGNLTINPVSRSDVGVYTCTAQNDYGMDKSSTRLSILRLPTFIDILPPKITVIVRQSLELRCYASSEDRLDVAYMWTHNGLKLHSVISTYNAIIVDGGSLWIHNISFANAGDYECIVHTVVGHIESRSTVRVEGPPSSPGGVQIYSESKKTIKLQWIDGSTNGRQILFYIVGARTKWNNTWRNITEVANGGNARKIDLYSERKEVTLEDSVTPWATYEFRLYAVNELGTSPPSDPSPQHNIPPDRPYKYPSYVSGGGGKIGDLTITWTPLALEDQNGPNIHYKVYWRRRGVEREFQSFVLRNSTREGVAIVPIAPEFFYTEYDVKVQAINDIGPGPESPIITIHSAEDIPHIQPQSISAKPFNSTAMNVSWSPVSLTRENIRGRLIGYRLKYWKENSIEDSAIYYLSRYTRPWALIVGLHPDTQYYVKTMVFNGAGAGPESERILQRTYRKSPQNPPTSVFVKGVNPSTFKVVWRYVAPNQDEEPITGYKVRVWPMNEDISRATDTLVPIGSKLEAYVENLSPGKRYHLRVMAYSNGGDGRMSSPTVNIQMGREEAFTNSGSQNRYKFFLSLLTVVISMFFSPSLFAMIR